MVCLVLTHGPQTGRLFLPRRARASTPDNDAGEAPGVPAGRVAGDVVMRRPQMQDSSPSSGGPFCEREGVDLSFSGFAAHARRARMPRYLHSTLI